MSLVRKFVPVAYAGTMAASKRRFVIMGLLFVTVVVTYLDRSNLSIAAPNIAKAFGLHSVQLGMMFSAYGWTYTPLQIPGGWLVDRVHPRVLYPLTIFFWSIATFCLGLSAGLVMLIILRMAVGLFEVPGFLMNNRIVTTWFGERERASCIAVYTSAEFVGLAFLTPVLAWFKVAFGWPAVFFFTGALGLVWAFVFWRLYRDPAEFPGVNAAEIALIRVQRWHTGSVEPDYQKAKARRWIAVAGFCDRARSAQAVGNLFWPFCLGHHGDILPHLVPHLSGHLSASRLHQGGAFRFSAICGRVPRRSFFRRVIRLALSSWLQPWFCA